MTAAWNETSLRDQFLRRQNVPFLLICQIVDVKLVPLRAAITLLHTVVASAVERANQSLSGGVKVTTNCRFIRIVNLVFWYFVNIPMPDF